MRGLSEAHFAASFAVLGAPARPAMHCDMAAGRRSSAGR